MFLISRCCVSLHCACIRNTKAPCYKNRGEKGWGETKFLFKVFVTRAREWESYIFNAKCDGVRVILKLLNRHAFFGIVQKICDVLYCLTKNQDLKAKGFLLRAEFIKHDER